MKKTKRVSVSLPIPVLAKLYLVWQINKTEHSSFSEFVSNLVKKGLENHEKTKQSEWLSVFFKKQNYDTKYDVGQHKLATYRLSIENAVVVIIFHGSKKQIDQLYTDLILSETAKLVSHRNVLMVFDKSGLLYDYLEEKRVKL